VVTTPDLPSIMGMQVFLKNHLLRCIDRKFSYNGFRPLRPMFKSLLQQPMERLPTSLKELKSRMTTQDAAAEQTFSEVTNGIRPRVLFNMGVGPEESRIALSLRKSIEEVLAIEADFFGFVFQDPAVRQALAARKPFLPGFRDSLAARNILKVAERIVKFWPHPVPDSAALMINHVLQGGGASGRPKVFQ
jgi:MinD-like ATPase involved in chromosome partitioning or flagellar assembly